ncbi:MAG: undecaprenyldiphospho-muramoylpentapeptide beta-N-acetylglucosaminyltransferase [Lactimicrobium sp.]|uniref:undecaprenyldiphospho-muramoylpentapeptide beta-N-acetylglucosaminyltransferase n=1 Tax=Lactimicrobium sp. TaxID=2563780 RepID=UPI002F353AE2
MKVLIAAGGTGGHIYPALALAEILKRKEPDCQIVFWGSSNRMESRLIPEKGYPFYGAKMSGMNSGISAKVKSAVSLLKAKKLARTVIRKEKPDIVVAFGNYISVPVVEAASACHIPVMLHEQNSFMGKANRFLAKKADAIAICYDANREQMPSCADKMRLTGNPEAQLAAGTICTKEDLIQTGLNPDIPFVVFMMGSLGSESVSKVIDEACGKLDDSYQVLIAAGKANDYVYQTKSDAHIHIVPYIDGKKMLKACRLAVVRAGATTMAELSAIGTPAILIPSPNVPNNHQVFNAMELVKKDAAVMLEEKDLSAERLADMVNDLMKDDDRLHAMAQNALATGRRDAADQMIAWMKELVH